MNNELMPMPLNDPSELTTKTLEVEAALNVSNFQVWLSSRAILNITCIKCHSEHCKAGTILLYVGSRLGSISDTTSSSLHCPWHSQHDRVILVFLPAHDLIHA